MLKLGFYNCYVPINPIKFSVNSRCKNHCEPDRVTFSGRYVYEPTNHELIKGDLQSQTHFFRDTANLEYLADHIKSHMTDKDVINIADFGSSTGEEAYTLAMLMDDSGRKVKITGYDLNPKAIEAANEGIYPISRPGGFAPPERLDAFDDYYLAFEPRDWLLTAEKREKELFHKFFNEIPESEALNTTSYKIDEYAIKDIKRQYGKDAVVTKYFRIKPEKKDLCQFKQGDITKLDEFLEPGSVDILLFRNSLYHLTMINQGSCGYSPKKEEEVKPILTDLFGKIHSTLSEGGLFVLGTYPLDHDTKGIGKLIYQTLEEQGFEPVFSNKGKPSIWKKSAKNISHFTF